jgi:hypothetical protein
MAPRLLWAALAAGCGGYRTHDHEDRLPRDRDPPPDCASGEIEEGCACDALEPVLCYDGEAETQGVGSCAPGLRTCLDGVWGPCEGEWLPVPETCNGSDDDCDGSADEGVLSACANCDPDCGEIWYGHEPGQTPFDGDQGKCIEVIDGDLVPADSPSKWPRLWIPNTTDGTISSIDAQSRTEVGRYRTGADGASDAPSRTSVDFRSDVVVANRSPDGQSSVTRVRAFECEDQDGDGIVTTSMGRSDVLAFGDDECVMWSTDVGEPGASAQAVAGVDRVGLDGVIEERAWVGLAREHRFVEIDRADGSLTGAEVDVSPCAPFGAVIERKDVLWSACGDSYIARVDVSGDPGAAEILVGPGIHLGIALDESGRVWTGGDVARYDPEVDEWTSVDGIAGFGVSADSADGLWVGDCRSDGIAVGTCRIDVDSLEVDGIDARSRAIEVDWDGYPWGIPVSGVVDIVDPDSLEVDDTIFDDCDGAGGACLGGPEAYSGLIGIQLRYTTSCVGEWQVLVEGCGEGRQTSWTALEWLADVPEGASVSFFARAAETVEGLWAEPFEHVASLPGDVSPAALGESLGDRVHAEVLEVEAHLSTTVRDARPVVHAVGVQRSCR